jgi:hypothetical protein
MRRGPIVSDAPTPGCTAIAIFCDLTVSEKMMRKGSASWGDAVDNLQDRWRIPRRTGARQDAIRGSDPPKDRIRQSLVTLRSRR